MVLFSEFVLEVSSAAMQRRVEGLQVLGSFQGAGRSGKVFNEYLGAVFLRGKLHGRYRFAQRFRHGRWSGSRGIQNCWPLMPLPIKASSIELGAQGV